MCYSAMVTQHCKKLGIKLNARIDLDLFGLLFQERLKGSGAKIGMELEQSFLESPKTAIEKRIAKMILEWRELEIEQLKADLDAQEERLAKAEKALKSKTTKKSQEEIRIATNKIEGFKKKINMLSSDEPPNEEARIWSKFYAPLVVEEKGERIIRPFRYLFRPKGTDSDFEKQFYMLYNARQDNLHGRTWSKVYGKHHGILTIKSFFEQCGKRGEVRFEPKSGKDLFVPCLFDRNTEDQYTLDSFAMITGDPNPEVLKAGHDRTPIVLKPENTEKWLDTSKAESTDYDALLIDKQKNFFEDEDVVAKASR